MSTRRIEPRTLKGFRDYLPDAMSAREWLMDTAKGVYKSFGFAPIDTPALEYSEILLGKGGAETDKQVYRFKDHGDRDIALRFDLTVPFARFAAQHIGELGTPFKRYHLGSVWRGENTQRGRYREFMQCDFDIIGTDSPQADVEIALVINALFEALGVERFTIHINNRKLLSGLLQKIGLGEKTTPVLRALDKLAKVGAEKVGQEISENAGASEAQVNDVLRFASLSGSNAEILRGLADLVVGSAEGQQGHQALSGLLQALEAAGVPPERAKIDLSIARGLDYYTGSIFETFLDALPTIGSVCSGGRYDDLASLYTNQSLPGVGASLGLDRLLAALEELGTLKHGAWSKTIFIPFFEAARYGDYLALASRLRKSGLFVELYPEPKKLGAQLKYADRRGHRLAIVAGENEWKSGIAQVKELRKNQAIEVAFADLPRICSELLAAD